MNGTAVCQLGGKSPLLASLVLLMTLPAIARAVVPDLYTGIWVLRDGSAGGSGGAQILTINVVGDTETYRSELTFADGKRQVTDYTAMYDGKEHRSVTRITEPGRPTIERVDSVILIKVNERTRERHWKQDGRLVRILRRMVSTDGKTLTSQIVEVDAQGRERPAGTLIFGRH